MNYPYIAQGQPVVFIGGFWIDDAQACEWQDSAPKEPLYGFRDVQYREVAHGQELVHGVLDLNFRYKGYLTLALARLTTLGRRIEKALEEGISIPGIEGGARSEFQATAPYRLQQIIHSLREPNIFQSAGIDPRRMSLQERRDMLEKSFQQFDIETFTRLSDAMADDLWTDGRDLLGVPYVEEVRPTALRWPLGFDMSVVYDQPDPLDVSRSQDPARVELIRDVHFVGQSKIIANTVPGGGRAVIERYQFLARTVE